MSFTSLINRPWVEATSIKQRDGQKESRGARRTKRAEKEVFQLASRWIRARVVTPVSFTTRLLDNGPRALLFAFFLPPLSHSFSLQGTLSSFRTIPRPPTRAHLLPEIIICRRMCSTEAHLHPTSVVKLTLLP